MSKQPVFIHQPVGADEPAPAYRLKGIAGQRYGVFRGEYDPGRQKPKFAWARNGEKLELIPRELAKKIQVGYAAVVRGERGRRAARCAKQARKYNRRKPAGRINVSRLRGKRTR